MMLPLVHKLQFEVKSKGPYFVRFHSSAVLQFEIPLEQTGTS